MNPNRTVTVTVIFPLDPFSNEIGGAETWIRGFIKNAPDDFNVEFVGLTTDANRRPPRKWMKGYLGGRELKFFPLFARKRENKKPAIPMALSFTVALKLSRMKFPKRVLFFNRIEPAIIFRGRCNPKVVVVHNDISKQHMRGISEVLWSRFPRAYLYLEKLIFKATDLVYTVSSETLKFYQSRYAELQTNFSFMPTSADSDLFYPPQRPKRSLREELIAETGVRSTWSDWILFVGRLQEQKSPIRLIDTFAAYLKNHRQAGLIIIGDGTLRAAVEDHIKGLSMTDNVVVLGNLNHETVGRFYRASNVLLLTSNFEGMPICVLEALACGVPVVCTNVGEVKRVVIPGFSGEVVECFSPFALSTALATVLSAPEIYSESNCVTAVSEYTPQKVMQPLYDAIRELYNRNYSPREDPTL